MKYTKPENLEKRLAGELLPAVRVPGRYIGGEFNQIVKPFRANDLHFGLCFPDIYEIGMSNTAVSIIYDLVNSLDYASCERIFCPWTDAAAVMREKSLPLHTLETKTAAQELDVLGFSVTTELCHTNILLMLDLAGIPLLAGGRGEEDPLVLGGGQIANCCEPLADFFDMFIVGEAEDALPELLERLHMHKTAATPRKEILLDMAKSFEWLYVPSLYEFEYDGENITAFKPLVGGLRCRFENAVVEDFENAHLPQKPIVPFVQAVHERVSIEVMRSCPGRCRFCQASFSRRPVRVRSVDKIVETAKANYHATGFDTISLLSLSTADYPWLNELVDRLNEYFTPLKVGLSLPSLKVDKQLELVPKMAASVRKGGLTIAVEAASEKLRRVINKPITDENLFKAIDQAYQNGFQRVKLYFMAGFPGETEDDIRRIADLSNDVAQRRRKFAKGAAEVSAAVSWLIPKPHTPYGWLGQRPAEYFENVKKIILERKYELNARSVRFKFHGIEGSVLETAMARGDRRLGNVILNAYNAGACFDLWRENFDFQLWQRAFSDAGIDLYKLAQKQYGEDDILPWQHLGGPERGYLLKHYHAALEEAK
jgi:radical SAM family uncharacterized protein